MNGASDKSDRAVVNGAGQAVSALRAAVPSAVAWSDFTDDYRTRVCKIGQGEDCCRYLTMGAAGWGCEKRSLMRDAIDRRAAKMNAKGDNCGGCFKPLPAFILLHDRFDVPAGSIIYRAAGHDYGLASDDEGVTGIPHTSMTLDPAGGYPFFTVPNPDFEPAQAIEARSGETEGLDPKDESAVPEGNAP